MTSSATEWGCEARQAWLVEEGTGGAWHGRDGRGSAWHGRHRVTTLGGETTSTW